MHVKKNLNKYVSHGEIHKRNTRQSNELRLDLTRLTKSRNATNYYGPKIFNKLPLDIRLLPINMFHSKIKEILLNGAYYSFDEDLCDVTIC